MAHCSDPGHIFVDMDGNQIDLDINTQYMVVETIFKAYSSSNQGSSTQKVVGTFYYRVVSKSTIREEPEIY